MLALVTEDSCCAACVEVPKPPDPFQPPTTPFWALSWPSCACCHAEALKSGLLQAFCLLWCLDLAMALLPVPHPGFGGIWNKHHYSIMSSYRSEKQMGML